MSLESFFDRLKLLLLCFSFVSKYKKYEDVDDNIEWGLRLRFIAKIEIDIYKVGNVVQCLGWGLG